MMTRRWQDGDRFEIDGLYFRVRTGVKSADDLRLDVWARFDNGAWSWRPVRMQLGAVLADFFFENEDTLYPRDQGYAGGHYYLRYCNHAALEGFDKADHVLRFERARKQLAKDNAEHIARDVRLNNYPQGAA